MKKLYESVNIKFLQIADAVSFGMGTPTNIIFWILAVAVWFILGIADRKLFEKNTFLPAWFTSTSWNFPLNTITTLAELYIGFLVAAATNRAERKMHQIINNVKYTVDEVKKISKEQNKILAMLIKYEKRDLKKEDVIIKDIEQKKPDRRSHMDMKKQS